MGRKVSDSQSVRVTVPAADPIIKGNFYLYQGFFGMAFQDKAANTTAPVDVILDVEQCEYETSQITVANAFAKGDAVYYDPATKLLTTVAGALRMVARVTVAKDAGNVIMMHLGPQL